MLAEGLLLVVVEVAGVARGGGGGWPWTRVQAGWSWAGQEGGGCHGVVW